MIAIIYTIILLKSVAVHKLQVAIIARSSQTVRIDWQHLLSRDRASVRPSNFFYPKNTQNVIEHTNIDFVVVDISHFCFPAPYLVRDRSPSFMYEDVATNVLHDNF